MYTFIRIRKRVARKQRQHYQRSLLDRRDLIFGRLDDIIAFTRQTAAIRSIMQTRVVEKIITYLVRLKLKCKINCTRRVRVRWWFER